MIFAHQVVVLYKGQANSIHARRLPFSSHPNDDGASSVHDYNSPSATIILSSSKAADEREARPDPVQASDIARHVSRSFIRICTLVVVVLLLVTMNKLICQFTANCEE